MPWPSQQLICSAAAMKATKRGKILIFACLGASVAGLLGTAGLFGVERLESRREFCNACHLPGNLFAAILRRIRRRIQPVPV